jgi:hypothetical protein
VAYDELLIPHTRRGSRLADAKAGAKIWVNAAIAIWDDLSKPEIFGWPKSGASIANA